MDNQIMVYTYNVILFSHKKKWNTNRCYNMDEPQNIMLSERSQTQKAESCCMIPLGKKSRTGKSVSRMQVGGCQKLGVRGVKS